MELGLEPCLPESKSPPCSVTPPSAAEYIVLLERNQGPDRCVPGSRPLLLGPQSSSSKGLPGSPLPGRQRHTTSRICIHTRHRPPFSLPSHPQLRYRWEGLPGISPVSESSGTLDTLPWCAEVRFQDACSHSQTSQGRAGTFSPLCRWGDYHSARQVPG